VADPVVMTNGANTMAMVDRCAGSAGTEQGNSKASGDQFGHVFSR